MAFNDPGGGDVKPLGYVIRLGMPVQGYEIICVQDGGGVEVVG